MFYGPGAGKLPTASAVVGDIIDVAHGALGGSVKRPYFENATAEDVADFEDYTCARYYRFANTTAEVNEVLGESAQQLLAKDGYVSVITTEMSEREAVAAIANKLCVLSCMRVL
jgi:homoserine dehydrogenase